MNLRRYRAIIKTITNKPECWNQNVWHCGTQHCVAGHAQLRQLKSEKLKLEKFQHFPSFLYVTGQNNRQTQLRRYVVEDACRWLGISEYSDERYYLFDSLRTLKELQKVAETGKFTKDIQVW